MHRTPRPYLRFRDEPNAEEGGSPASKPDPAPPIAESAPPAPKSEPKQTAALNEFGFPDKTPVADMPAEQQAAYWRHQSKRHESRSLKALGFTDEQVDAIVAARKNDPGVVAQKFTGYDELAGRVGGLEKDRDAARIEAEVARAVAAYHVSAEDAGLLDGLTGDRLTAMAKRLGGTTGSPAAPPDGAGKIGAPVGGPRQIQTREEYAALPPQERREARKDGRLDHLLGIAP